MCLVMNIILTQTLKFVVWYILSFLRFCSALRRCQLAPSVP